jgi:hypothetical protein
MGAPSDRELAPIHARHRRRTLIKGAVLTLRYVRTRLRHPRALPPGIIACRHTPRQEARPTLFRWPASPSLRAHYVLALRRPILSSSASHPATATPRTPHSFAHLPFPRRKRSPLHAAGALCFARRHRPAPVTSPRDSHTTATVFGKPPNAFSSAQVSCVQYSRGNANPPVCCGDFPSRARYECMRGGHDETRPQRAPAPPKFTPRNTSSDSSSLSLVFAVISVQRCRKKTPSLWHFPLHLCRQPLERNTPYPPLSRRFLGAHRRQCAPAWPRATALCRARGQHRRKPPCRPTTPTAFSSASNPLRVTSILQPVPPGRPSPIATTRNCRPPRPPRTRRAPSSPRSTAASGCPGARRTSVSRRCGASGPPRPPLRPAARHRSRPPGTQKYSEKPGLW